MTPHRVNHMGQLSLKAIERRAKRYVRKMGTDIYMEWKGKSKQDSQKQLTAFSISAGNKGYLRASIHMQKENALLRMLFNVNKYWDKHEKAAYDFKGNFEILKELGFKYLTSVYMGIDFETTEKEHLEKQANQKKLIMAALKKMNIPGKIITNNIQDFRFAVMWLESLFEFFELGIELQDKGFEPYPYISW